MIPLGLSVDEQAAFHRALTRDHDIDVRISLLTLEERHLSDVSSWILGGQVVVDGSAEVTRSCQVTLLDPEQRAGLDSDRPGDSIHMTRMLSVTYGVWVDELGWVRVPIFRGPIAKVSRDGDVLDVQALGKEHLLRSDGGIVHNYRSGQRRTSIIRDIAIRMGEKHHAIPTWAARVSKRVGIPKLGAHSDPWPWMLRLAVSMKAQLFYDGRGTLRLRQPPLRPSWWFYESHLLSRPTVTVDDAEMVNTVWVKGTPPEGKKWVIEARGSLPPAHPLSPQRLGRNGVKRYLTEVIEDDTIRTRKDAEAARDRRLKELEVATMQVEMDAFVIPHLDTGDLCHLAWDEAPGMFRLGTFTIPLTAGDAMSVGYAKETRRRPARRRRRLPAGSGLSSTGRTRRIA